MPRDTFLFELPNHIFLPEVVKSDPKREPKGDQKPPKLMSDLSKRIVFTIQTPCFTISGELWEHTVSTLLSGHCMLLCVFLFAILYILNAKRLPK